MTAYALLGFLFLNGITAIIIHSVKRENERQIERLTDISRIILYPAVFCLATGIFIGAVWANVSWGQYWSWDPKETWALITMLIYAFAFHQNSIKHFNNPLFFHCYMTIAFLSVLVTYFGVNFILGGMHSYA
jgi:ABC-type transport system involved in cytochrome c biogenesis permease subunit